jgi:hypothetical protein
MRKSRRRIVQGVAALLLCGLVYAGVRFLPFGLTDAASSRKTRPDSSPTC